MLNSLIRWSINNRWAVSLLAMIMIVVGIATTASMPVDVFPDFSPVQVVVLTECPGYAPEEVETLITMPLEMNLNGTANVSVVRSVSTIGLSVITIVFQDHTNIFTARQLVSEKLQASRSQLPDGVGQPFMAPITTAAGDILKLGLYSTGDTDPMELRTLVDWTIRMRLLAVPGVSNVVVIGGEEKQYQVLVDPQKLKEYDVTLEEVIEAARNSNANAAGGFLRTREEEFLIRGLGRAASTADIARTAVKVRGNTPVLIGNVAEVKIGPAFKIGDAIVDGHPGVVLTVFKQPWSNTLMTTQSIEKALAEVTPGLPKDVVVVPTFRQADFIEVAVRNVTEAIGIGAILVVLVLFVFLQNWRTALISLTAIPLSLLIAILSLKFQGATINTMTLGGLAIAIGEVVDDAIIDVENVFTCLRANQHSQNPLPPLQVIFHACVEVRSSVVYATFIIALVFLPVMSLGGLEGKIFSPLAVAYLIALMGSLLVALTVTPAMCAILLTNPKRIPPKEGFFVAKLKAVYDVFLSLSLTKPIVVVMISIFLLVLSAMPITLLGSEFLPAFDENNLIVVATSMPGTSLEATTGIGTELTGHFVKQHDVLAADQRAGRAERGEDYGGSNFSEYDIRLKPDSPHKRDVLYHVRKEFSQIPGLVTDTGSYLRHRMDHALSGVNAAIAVKVFGSDLPRLHEKAKEVEKLMKTIPGAVDVHIEPIIPVPQISIKVNRQTAARYAVKVGDLQDAIEAAFKGVMVSQVLEGQRSFDLYVWFDPHHRNSIEVIESTLVDTPSGVKVPLGTLATVSQGQSPNTISHENIMRRVVVQANVAGRDLGGVIDDARSRIAKEIDIPTGYFVEYGGQFEAQEQATEKIIWFGILAIMGMFALLWMAFRSFWAAMIVLANLPMALVGGIWAVLLSGAILSVGSMVGFITLLGISTRNGIMMVSHFNKLYSEGKELDEIIRGGALDRLSPVLMTALTAALGVAPIAILGGAGRELEQPMAVVILGGMLSSTALTLVLLPALFKLAGTRALYRINHEQEL